MATKLLRRFIKTNKAPAAIGPYNQAVAVGETVYVSGQIGLDPDSGSMVEGGFEAEAHQVFKNIGAILESSGLTYNDVDLKGEQLYSFLSSLLVAKREWAHSQVKWLCRSNSYTLVYKQLSEKHSGKKLEVYELKVVKCTVLLASMDEFQTLNAIYGSYFKSNYPARAAYQVAALPKNARVEIECIAVKNMTDE